MSYTVMAGPAKHTCWDEDTWDGTLVGEKECAGCDQAAAHKCQFCGYGHAFTTHNDLAHLENGDDAVPTNDDELMRWHDAPHLYALEPSR